MMNRTRRRILAACQLAALVEAGCSGLMSGGAYVLKYDRRKDSMFKVLDAHHIVIERNEAGIGESVNDAGYRAKYNVRV